MKSEPCEVEEWVYSELGGIDFGDRRMNDRFLLTASRLASSPESSINQACHSWKETKAAYRMFGNPIMDQKEILRTHVHQTSERMAAYDRVFALQDTTMLDFDSHTATQGLGSTGRLKSHETLGLFLHSTLIVTEQGLPLGFLSQRLWGRKLGKDKELSRQQKSTKLHRLPIEEKESFKWLEGLQDTQRNKPDGTQVITIADQEADISELICRAKILNMGFLIRAQHNRRLAANFEALYLRQHLESVPEGGIIELDISAAPGRTARKAKVVIKFSPVTLRPSERKTGARSEIALFDADLYVVLAREIDPPNDKERIDWLLLSSEAVLSLADAQWALQTYKLRWNIEIFHKILKSGCRIESCRLGSAEKLTGYITLMTLIAFRIFYMTKCARTAPDSPCTDILTTEEWQVLYARKKQTTVFPANPPSLRDATAWIAELGGYLNRKSDGPPGPITIWRGMRVLAQYVEILQIYLL